MDCLNKILGLIDILFMAERGGVVKDSCYLVWLVKLGFVSKLPVLLLLLLQCVCSFTEIACLIWC